MLSLEDRVQPAPGAVSSMTEDELVVVLPEQARFLVLNGTGAQVWHLADGRRSLGEIARELAQSWQIDMARAQVDVLYIAGQLIERSALVKEEAGSISAANEGG